MTMTENKMQTTGGNYKTIKYATGREVEGYDDENRPERRILRRLGH